MGIIEIPFSVNTLMTVLLGYLIYLVMSVYEENIIPLKIAHLVEYVSLVKRILLDEGIVALRVENLYMHYFTGEKVLQRRPPMNPADLTKFRKRAGIEPLIGHLKSDHHLKVSLGDAINTLIAVAVYNMRHWMCRHASSLLVSCLLALVRRLENVLFGNEKQYACRYPILAGVV